MKNNMNKVLAVALAVTMLALAIVAGTLAYLVNTTHTITNVFTKGEGVDIALFETKHDLTTVDATAENQSVTGYTYVPGTSQDKGIYITNTGARDCFVFIKLEISTVLLDYIEYTVNPGWVQVGADETAEGITTRVYAYAKDQDTEDEDPTVTMTYLSNTENTSTAKLFNQVNYLNNSNTQAEWNGNLTIVATGYAIQTELEWNEPADVWAHFND